LQDRQKELCETISSWFKISTLVAKDRTEFAEMLSPTKCQFSDKIYTAEYCLHVD